MTSTRQNDSSYGNRYSEEDLADRVRRYIDTQEKRVELMEQEFPILENELMKYRYDEG